MYKKIVALSLLLIFLHLTLPGFAHEDYRLGPEDEIEIRVWSHDDLTRKVRVGLNGSISFPFVGEIKAQGMSVLDLQRELEKRLGPKYIIDPHVSITVTEYKSQKFFVVGNVNKPGTYPLTKPIRVVEALSLAGGLDTGSGSKAGTGSAMAVIVRAKPGEKRDQPRLPDQTPLGDKVKVSLSAAMAGDPQHNLEVKNGDTIYVPALFYYVQGQVKNSGRFPYEENMTVLMAITTAGGFTDKASSRRAYIVREKDGKKQDIKAKLDDPVQPGDVVTVPESWF
jgi:polysaccharide export outer membrane protein